MNTTVRVLLFTLGLPAIAGAMAWACMAKVDANIRDQVRQQYPHVTEEQLAQTTVSSLADAGAFEPTAEVPVIYAHLKLARLTAVLTGTLGLALIGGIYYAGRATRTRRDLLLRIFRPGLFLTLTTVGVLTAAQAFAAAYSFYYFESIFIERVHFILILGVAVGGLLALVAVVRAMFSLKHTGKFEILGRPVSRTEQPGLWAMVDQVCTELHATAPDSIVLGLEPSFYVTESEVVTPDRPLNGRTLFLSLSLSRLLSVAELRAIIGHEMAHFIGEDTVFSQRFFPVYRGTLVALANLSGNAVHGSIAIAQLPAISFLGFFFESFVTSEKNLSRLRETEADATGARVGGSTSLATALIKVHAYVDGWQKVMERFHDRNDPMRHEKNLSIPLHAHASALAPEVLAKAGTNHIFHPTDSHPTLAARLEALQLDLPSVLPLTVIPSFEQSAASLITEVETLEIAQSDYLRTRLR